MSRGANVALWIAQILLALLFAFAGSMKFIMPVSEMTKQMPMPGAVIHLVGIIEIAGALGLVLPGLLRRSPVLVPAAATGLLFLMCGATAVSISAMGYKGAVLPVLVGLVLLTVAIGRGRQFWARIG